MLRSHLPLNALRAFEASARHLSFTRAAIELCVTQAAVSHQVKSLEAQLNVTLFKRLPRGLMLTSEGESLLPVLRDAFDCIALTLDQFEGGHYREVLTVGAVGTFAVGWLLPRLADFHSRYPLIDLRLSTHNNRVDVAAEGLDYAIRFGAGAWHGTDACPLLEAPLTVLCVPQIAEQLRSPADVLKHTLLRSYRADEWNLWFQAAGLPSDTRVPRSVVFDSSLAMMEAALQGAGVALAPARMFSRQLENDVIRQPFEMGITTGSYWLTRLQSRAETPAMVAFKGWLQASVA
ncbi:MAG: LysR family transcriptional regulator [Pseudomonadales bacterium RIFCSPLOWO2_12_60_38]|uniref:LysR family transcriptional regulator n=1 Tax=Pseudomonas TaxID=286 RepID=UPI0003DCC783|nr:MULTISPECIES: LysR family transcriptional regulator [unclassified Pseudomonas]ETK41155.1 LysR family transcriptional regulator [Pseudomonas fluorescens FH5]OHC34719.1 MAG: LysR family transcriptional regulator [Pseudomonadales bacterium RIFCSPLOWO2_12_60_38]OHC41150.1 MAG: LysR family transcriptional regulator [Pseudomonadales bacterium RIFCSPLOWO2_12_FULL_59_450]PTT12980.1 LysR family transcriptional regulator [Pseudomonas sp. HMWF034]PVV73326.1 LysR family transcriptional regulator [Pseud